jgi:predicted transcriptional regulator
MKNSKNVISQQKLNDIYIITYNEGRKKFDENDYDALLDKIIDLRPNIIILFVQEASTTSVGSLLGKEAKHFAHVFETSITKKIHLKPTNKNSGLKYERFNKLSKKTILGSFVPKNKNVKARIYYNSYNVTKVGKVDELNNSKKQVKYNLINQGFINNNSSVNSGRTNLGNNSNRNSIYSQNNTSSVISNSNSQKNISKNVNNNSNEIKIFLEESNISTMSGLSSSLQGTLFKGAIYIKIIIILNKVEYRFIFINTHLYFTGDGNTGYSKRKEEFMSLLSEFDLYNSFANDYNIFFCGDLNFRLTSKDIINPSNIIKLNNSQLNQILSPNGLKINSSQIIKNELYNLLNNLNTRLSSQTNETLNKIEKNAINRLIKILENRPKLEQKDKNEITKLREILKMPILNEIYKKEIFQLIRRPILNLIHAIKKSMNKFLLTCRYKEDNNVRIDGTRECYKETFKKPKSYFNKKIITSKSGIFNCEKSGTPRVPSMCDRILYAISDSEDPNIGKITVGSLETLNIPLKSDHLMLTLDVGLIG